MKLLRGEFEVKPSSGSGLDKFDVAYFTACCDDLATVKKYARELKLDYPILSDSGCQASRKLGVLSEGRTNPQRWTYFIDKDGKIQYIDKKVKPTNHGADVVAKLTELGVPRK